MDEQQKTASLPKLDDVPITELINSRSNALANALRARISGLDPAQERNYAAHGSSPAPVDPD